MKRRRRKPVIQAISPLGFDSFHVYPLLGLDEVGTGCIAGPVCAAGVVLPSERYILQALVEAGLQDSKKMTKPCMTRVYEELSKCCLYAKASFVSAKDVDRLGLGASLDMIFSHLIAVCYQSVEVRSVLIDGNSRRGVRHPHIGVLQGDAVSLTISAASVWAKVSRDRLMASLGNRYPGYLFERHKGYDTVAHRSSLSKLGASPIHRMSTRTLRELKE